jgi:hypothetical protein
VRRLRLVASFVSLLVAGGVVGHHLLSGDWL